MGICASQAASWASFSSSSSFAKLYEVDEKAVLVERPFAVIYKGKHRVAGEPVAIKRIQKFLSAQQAAQLEALSNADTDADAAATASAASRRRSGCRWESEVAITKQLSARHPNVIEFKQLFETKNEVLIVMEFVAGGELFDALTSDGAYSEWDAKRFAKDTLEALKFLHERNITHRYAVKMHSRKFDPEVDIKPENLLFTSRDSKGASIKVVNFAMAKLVDQDSAVTNSQLTWPYCAPEILASIDGFSSLVESIRRRKSSLSNDQPSSSGGAEPVSSGQAQIESSCATPVGVKCDVWSVGIVLYVLLSGAHPSDLDGRQTKDQVVQNILLGKFTMSDESSIWSTVSREAKSLLTALLEVDPEKRLSAAQALDHEWFASPHTPRHPLSVSVSDGLGQYQRLMRKKFRVNERACRDGSRDFPTESAEAQRRNGGPPHRNENPPSPNSDADSSPMRSSLANGDQTEQMKSTKDLGNRPLAEEAVRPVEIADRAGAGTPTTTTMKKQGSVMSRVFQKQSSTEDHGREHSPPIDNRDINLEEEMGFGVTSLEKTSKISD